jgi:hypothetical protein
MNLMLQQFIAVALPIMITIILTVWFANRSQNKNVEDMKAAIRRKEP